MTRILTILALVVITSLSSEAQLYLKILGHKADTVYPKLKGATEKEKMHLYNQLAFYHSLSQPDSAIYYAEMSLEMAEKYDDLFEKASALRNIGNASILAGNYRDAVLNLQQALNMFEQLNDARKIVEVDTDLGKLNYDLEDYEKALAYGENALNLIERYKTSGEELVTPFEMGILLGMMGGAAREAGNYELAEKYFKDYIAHSKKFHMPSSIHTTWVKSLGETYEFSGDLDSALKYTYMARSALPENKDKPFSEQTGYEGAIGGILYRQGETDKALPLLRKSYQDEIRKESFYYAAHRAINIGEHYYKTEIMDSASFWLNRAYEDAGKVFLQIQPNSLPETDATIYSGYQTMMTLNQEEMRQRYFRLMVWVYHHLYKFHKKQGEVKFALEYHEKKMIYYDSLNQVTTNLEEKRTQTRFESERMEQQLLLLEQEAQLAKTGIRQTRLFLAGISGILVAVLFIVLLYLRQKRIKAEQERIALQQRLFRSQMNPHFLYNSLASIQNFIVTEDPDNASVYLSRFSGLVRSILDSSTEEFVPMEKEIELIKNYLSLQKVRYAEILDYRVEVDESLDTENMLIPPMLAQPFIENAIEHGIKHKKGKGQVIVRFMRLKDCTIFEVEDDGVGREKVHELQMRQQEKHKSMATDNTRKRIEALNKKHRLNITMEIIDLTDETGKASGTLVRFRMPMG